MQRMRRFRPRQWRAAWVRRSCSWWPLFPLARSDSAVDRAALIEVSAALTRTQEQLLETIETETVVSIYAARNMPQGSVTQRTEREAAIQLALRAAADVPLEVLRLCALSLTQAAIVAEHSSRATANEVSLGVTLLRDAFLGAQSNLEARLGSLTDVIFSGVAFADDDGTRCSERTLHGSYVFAASGFTIAAGSAQPKAIVEVIDFNGDGTLSVPAATRSVNGAITRSLPSVGSYTVAEDCTGTIAFDGPSFDIFVSPRGNQLWLIQTNPNNVFEGSATRTTGPRGPDSR